MIKRCIDIDIYSAYNTRKSIKKIQGLPHAKKCFNTKCAGWFQINEKLNITNYKCSFCSQNNCIKCDSIHPNMQCYEYEMKVLFSEDNNAIDNLKKRLSVPRLKAHELIISKKVREFHQAENVVKLSDEYPDIDEADIIWAAKQTSDIENVKQFLKKTCELCTETFSQNHFFSMVHCTHSFCENCMKNYFEIQVIKSYYYYLIILYVFFFIFCFHKIKERSVLDWVCPMCKEPDMRNQSSSSDCDTIDPFEWLETALKKLLSDEVNLLLTDKLRDYALEKDPSFRWCKKVKIKIN